MSTFGGTPVVLPRRRARMERSIRIVHAMLVASFGVWTWTAGPDEPAHLVLAGAQLALAAYIAAVGERRWHVGWALGMLLFSMLPDFRAPSDLSDGLALGAVLISAMRTLPRRTYAAVMVTTVIADAALRSATGPTENLATTLVLYATVVSYTYAAGVLVETLDRSAQLLDRSEYRTAAVAVQEIADRQRERAVSAATRVLHDHVLNALRHAEGDPQLPAARVRRDAADAVSAVSAFEADGAPQPVDGDPFDELLADVAEASTLPISFEHDLHGPVPELSPEQWQAATRALGEAVRNVHRHAEATHVTLRIRGGQGRLSFAVADDGRGFAAGASEGVGIRESIRAGTEAAGGQVSVSSDAAGSTVEVTFTSPHEVGAARDALARSYYLTLQASDGRLVRTTATPFVVMWVLVAAWFVPQATHPRASLVLLVLCALLAVAAVHRLSHRPPTVAWLLGVAACSSALHVFGLVILPPDSYLDPRSWHVSFVTVPVILLALLVPVRWGASLIAVSVAVSSAGAVLRPEISGHQVVVLFGLVVPPSLMLVLGAALRRNGREVERERSAFIAAATERARQRSFASVGTQRLEHTRRVVVPWLGALARGELPLSSSSVRSRAGLLARDTRDELYAPGFYDPDLRRLVGDYRSRGGRVEISPGFPGGAHRRRSGRLLAGLATTLPPGHRIGLSEVDGRVRLVVAPSPPPDALDGVLVPAEVRRSGDDFALVWEFEDAT